MFRSSKKDILNGNILQQMLLFFFPALLGYLLQQGYTFVDSMVLGRFVGKEALAAVGGSATAIINIILNLVAGIASAVTVLVAQNIGKGDMNKVSDSVKTGMFASVVIGAGVSILMILVSPFLLNIMKCPPETIKDSLIYMNLYFISLVPYFVYQTGVAILRALGDSKRPVYFILIIAITKIGFDLLFAGVFKLGVLGTSLATLLSHLSCAIVVLIIFHLTPDIYQYSIKKDFTYNKEDFIKVIRIGVPFAIYNMMFAIPNTFIQLKINGFGTDAIAAYYAFNTVDSLFWCYSNSVAAATLTMAGQNYGSGNIRRVKNVAYCAVAMEIFGAIMIGGSFYLFGDKILTLFLTDQAVINLSKRMLDIIAFSYLTYIPIEPVSSTCKGVGSGKMLMYIATITICVTRIIYMLFYPQRNEVYPVFAFALSWIITSIAYVIYFYTNKKLKVNKV